MIKIVILVIVLLFPLNTKGQVVNDNLLNAYYHSAINYFFNQLSLKGCKGKHILESKLPLNEKKLNDSLSLNLTLLKPDQDLKQVLVPFEKNVNRCCFNIYHKTLSNNPDTIDIYIKKLQFLDGNDDGLLFSQLSEKGLLTLKVFYDSNKKSWVSLNSDYLIGGKIKNIRIVKD